MDIHENQAVPQRDHSASSKKLACVVMMKDAPDQTSEDFVLRSATGARENLAARESLPEQLARPEVAAILMEHCRNG